MSVDWFPLIGAMAVWLLMLPLGMSRRRIPRRLYLASIMLVGAVGFGLIGIATGAPLLQVLIFSAFFGLAVGPTVSWMHRIIE